MALVYCIKELSGSGRYTLNAFGFANGSLVDSTKLEMLSLCELFKLLDVSNKLNDNEKFALFRRFYDFPDLSAEDCMRVEYNLGFSNIEGAPLRCWNCGGRKFKHRDYYEESILCEQYWDCSDCKARVGHWAYGQWQI